MCLVVAAAYVIEGFEILSRDPLALSVSFGGFLPRLLRFSLLFLRELGEPDEPLRPCSERNLIIRR